MFFLTFLLTTTISGTITSDVRDLMRAILYMDADKVKELLDKVDIDSKYEDELNVLHAATHSNGEITRLLISRGADRFINEPVRFIPSPLYHACFVTYIYDNSQPHIYEVMEAMLKAGADPNVSNPRLMRTPLHHIAMGSGVRLLLSYGANVNAKDRCGYTAASAFFSTDYRRKNQEVLYALAEGDADFAITNNSDDTIFHMKSDNSLLWTKELVIFLARNGVPLDALNNSGETALTKVLKRDLRLNFWEIVNQSTLYESLKDSFYAHMAEAGANLNARNQHGETLLHLAVLKYQEGMVKWFLENGADVEAKNADGDPPLLALVKQEKRNYDISYNFFPCKHKTAKVRAVIDVLVEGGANVDFKDGDGRDAAYYLRKSRMTWVDWYIVSSLKKDDQNLKNLYIYFGT